MACLGLFAAAFLLGAMKKTKDRVPNTARHDQQAHALGDSLDRVGRELLPKKTLAVIVAEFLLLLRIKSDLVRLFRHGRSSSVTNILVVWGFPRAHPRRW